MLITVDGLKDFLACVTTVALKTSFYLFLTAPLECSLGFFPFHGGCFSVNTKKALTWGDALIQCNREGGTLAKISREGLRYAFSNMLEEMRPKPNTLHFGLLTQNNWVWIDGSPLNGSLWMPGYPTGYHGVQSCAVLSAGSSRIKNVDCRKASYPLCQKKPGRLEGFHLHYQLRTKCCWICVCKVLLSKCLRSKAQQTLPHTHYRLIWSKPSYTHARSLLPVHPRAYHLDSHRQLFRSC